MTDLSILDDIQGWLGPAESQLLHDLAETIRLPQMIVEIGTYQGKSIVAMALDAQTPCFAIDPHEPSVGDSFQFGDTDRAALMANLVKAGVAWKVRLWDVQSQYAARGWPGHQIGLLFIDGVHSYEGVRADLTSWLPYVAVDGLVAFHDSNAAQIQQAIQGRLDLEYVQTADVTAVYRKVALPEPEALELLTAESVQNIASAFGVPAEMFDDKPIEYDAPVAEAEPFTEAERVSKTLRATKPAPSKAKAKGKRR